MFRTLLIMMVFSLSACGKTGDLYLPDDTTSSRTGSEIVLACARGQQGERV